MTAALHFVPEVTAAAVPGPGGEPDVTDLPFVSDRGGRRVFWDVSPTGRYPEDWALGEYYARALLALWRSQREPFPFCLGWIVRDMPRGQDMTGIEYGFLATLADVITLCGKEDIS